MADKVLPKDEVNPAQAEYMSKLRPTAKPSEKPAAEPASRTAARPGAKAAASASAGPAAAPRKAGADGDPGAGTEHEGLTGPRPWLSGALLMAPSWLVSMVVHMIILLVLAILTLPAGLKSDLRQLVVAPGEEEEFEELEELEDEILEDIDMDVVAVESSILSQQPEEMISPADDMEAAPVAVELSEFGLEHAPRNDLLATVGAYSGSGLSGRGSGKAGLVRKYGGTAGSEKAVAAALKWLAEHQMPDGGWSFAHHVAPRCQGQCRNPGKEAKARIGATAMAVLPFLGAGQTHKQGKYKTTVKSGLYFLTSRMKMTPQGGNLWEEGGRMYSHGLASITLCEAYAMTHDKGLHAPAQAALNFICYAQDPVGGGWRYQPRQKGDTSVVGWQIMALKSGHMAYLRVPPTTVKMASAYLDGVQANSGANYGYTDPGNGEATTAIGLLCRMYLGWKKDNPALDRGAKWISDKGPSKNNYYYNYYATQVMRHWEGELWKKWNGVMRDQLVSSQAQKGHEAGSWYDGGSHNDRGGRLYCTSMATMILEVYYRHLPIYRKQSTEEDFPL